MTVVYKTNFFLSLFHWRGSVWKTIWVELLIWLILYYLLRVFIYEVLHVSDVNRLRITYVVRLFYDYTNKLPLEFLLSFYVNQAVTRWWAQISILPWPDEIVAYSCSVLYKNDDKDAVSRRRTVGRLSLVAVILALRNVSKQANVLFPNLAKLKRCGFLTCEEVEIIEIAEPKLQYEIPLQWIHEIVRSKMNSTQGTLLMGLTNFRNQLRNLSHYSAMGLPLVYTQTASVAVYGYFLFAIIGEMFYEEDFTKSMFDLKIPVLTIFRFIFNVGWLKVAQDLAKPFGNDDDDIDLTYWLNRHIRLVFTTVDYTMVNMPSDKNWLQDSTTISAILDKFPASNTNQESNMSMREKLINKLWEKLRLNTVTRL